MTQCSHGFAQGLDHRYLDAQGRNGSAELSARHLNGVSAHVIWQLIVGLADRLADAEEYRQYDAGCATEALGQLAVGVELFLRILENAAELGQLLLTRRAHQPV